MKMEQTECSETSAYKIQTPGNYPEESIQHCYELLFTKFGVHVLKDYTFAGKVLSALFTFEFSWYIINC